MLLDEKSGGAGIEGETYQVSIPRLGYAEQNPDVWWEAVLCCLSRLREKYGKCYSEVAGIGFSGQMHGLVMVDADGRPIRPAILWLDQRSTKECNDLNERIPEDLITGSLRNRIFTGFALPSLLWVKKHEPEHFAAIHKVMQPKDYIRYKITGMFGAEVTDASASLMFDIVKRDWSYELQRMCGFPPSVFPECHESGEIQGRVSRECACLTGLGESVPVIYGMGDQHLDVVVSRLLNEYKVEIELSQPKVAFRETIRKKSDVEYKYKKQTGGHGQYGHVKMKFEPLGDLEKQYEFAQEVVGGAVPKNYYPAVEKGLQESVQKGPLAAYPVVGVKAILYDGSYHPVDSSEMAFKMATIQAFKKGFMDAGPILLEPIASLKVTVPDQYTGDVMGDLNKRRGRVLGMTPIAGGKQIVEADVPMTELYGYCTDLRSMTGGRGDYSFAFARYEQAPSDIQEKEVAARAAKVAEGSDE